MEYLDKTGLTALWAKIKNKIDTDAVLTRGALIGDSFLLKSISSSKTFGILTTPSVDTYISKIVTNMPINSSELIRASKFTLADTELAINTNFLMANGEVLAKDDLATDILTKSNVTATVWGSGVSDSRSVQSWIQLLMDQVYPRGTIDSKFEEITSRITSVLSWKGTKADLSAITQITQANKGDVWHSNANGKEYVATDAITGTARPEVWEELGGTQDLSYLNKALSGENLVIGTSYKESVLVGQRLDGTGVTLKFPIASASKTGMVRLYDSENDTLDTEKYEPLQISSAGVAYVDKRLDITENESSSAQYWVTFCTNGASRTNLNASDYFLYNPSKKTLYVNNIRQSGDVSDTLPPTLGTKTIGGATQIMYLSNGTLTAGESFTAITTAWINENLS